MPGGHFRGMFGEAEPGTSLTGASSSLSRCSSRTQSSLNSFEVRCEIKRPVPAAMTSRNDRSREFPEGVGEVQAPSRCSSPCQLPLRDTDRHLPASGRAGPYVCLQLTREQEVLAVLFCAPAECPSGPSGCEARSPRQGKDRSICAWFFFFLFVF